MHDFNNSVSRFSLITEVHGLVITLWFNIERPVTKS